MRNAPNIIETRNFNSYPTAENLIKLDRLYGDSVTTYDLSCIRPKKRSVKMKTAKDLQQRSSWMESMSKNTSQIFKTSTVDPNLKFSCGDESDEQEKENDSKEIRRQ